MSVFRMVEKNIRYGLGVMSSKFEVKTPDSSKRHRLNQLKTSHGSHIVKNGSIKDCTWLYHIVTRSFLIFAMAVELQYCWFACPEGVDRTGDPFPPTVEERVHHITNFGQSKDVRYSEDIVFVKVQSYV